MISHKIKTKIRTFNRFYTNVLGLLDRHILSSAFSLTEARVLLEIQLMPQCTAKKIIEKLTIDAGYLSRILNTFERKDWIVRENDSNDRRSSIIRLVPKGKQELERLSEKSDQQIERLIHGINAAEQKQLLDAMETIYAILGGNNDPKLRCFQASDHTFIVNAHRNLYAREYGFNDKFVQYVADAVSAFMDCHDSEKEKIWILDEGNEAKGCIAIVRESESIAQLRWFLLDQSLRGRGYGHKLLDTAIQFCREQGYKKVILWTVSDLKAARHLYGSKGFTCVQQHPNKTWTNHVITEEKWELVF
ncbi:bifunctional helix-turn-helix transcriptional regulator/GNAT family N-acetyltransferase [Sporolactobacillus nakayamae]|uniref:Transcriptional regulator, MarR family with acetyltransferase activity n=1 Tax=Sporolactobacillus nakayamae TaxID=269670 RepID=A0A1I2S5F4_9BACL|nr:helix-turn-helix domain-containing GNAT family N-acetyltransferase [Sporolactobacillus nakayamae]SFG46989.1 transcriptional regulator, MarR family with acetyltransferase activity [Sporolactobacillus nakayamae]